MGHEAGVDAVTNKKNCSRRESKPGCPARSLVTILTEVMIVVEREPKT